MSEDNVEHLKCISYDNNNNNNNTKNDDEISVKRII